MTKIDAKRTAVPAGTEAPSTGPEAAAAAHLPGPSGSSAAEAEFRRFFLPGPTAVRPEVLQAMVRPLIAHRGGQMRDLLRGMDASLRSVFQTRRPVYVSTSSATGLMEAAIVNLSRGRVLCLVSGAFSERFVRIAARCGREADVLEVEWGEPNDPTSLREVLEEQAGRYDLVTVVHSETSTGVLNPVPELARVVGEFDEVLLAVDGVTSVGGLRVAPDEWGLDFLLTGSQKALALPPGLAFGVASERALRRAETVRPRSYYFDLLEFERRAVEFQTTNTPAIPLLYALECQLGRIESEGLEARWERHLRMAERTWCWVEEAARALGEPLRVLAPPGYRSPTVTAIHLPERVSGTAIVRALRDRGYTIAAGYGKLREATLRIGHMGDHTLGELDELLEALEEVLGAACRT